MKLVRIVCLLLITQFQLQAQSNKNTDENYINANAEASNKITDNSTLDFYTVEELKLGTIVIPIHTRFSATLHLAEGRAFLKASSIKIRDEVYTIDWRAVGPDFKEGFPVIETEKSFEVYENQRLTFKVFSN